MEAYIPNPQSWKTHFISSIGLKTKNITTLKKLQSGDGQTSVTLVTPTQAMIERAKASIQPVLNTRPVKSKRTNIKHKTKRSRFTKKPRSGKK
jgi:hypothetical protein